MYTLGIDVGSGFSKAAVCKDGTLISYATMPSGGAYAEIAQKVSEEAINKAHILPKEISNRMATGYGAAAVQNANRTSTDISCHASGVHNLFPGARTVIDVGAQFSKVIAINDNGAILNFLMNEKCAGGSGKFLQIIARILHISIEELGPLSMTSLQPVQFTTACAVFAESEAVSRIAEGALPSDILAGVHRAMASKIANLVTRAGLKEACVVTGGGAKDIGLVKAIETELGVPVLVPPEPQITAALGAAILANG
jgi:predicted CoA-substrate-specific enzyme activase